MCNLLLGWLKQKPVQSLVFLSNTYLSQTSHLFFFQSRFFHAQNNLVISHKKLIDEFALLRL